MIVERRAYTFRPGKVAAFWDLQTRWNTDAVFGPILRRNISYFTTTAGCDDQVVHLYRFDSVEQWRASYDQYYQAQDPAYFALVRPMMLRQENALFIAPPIADLAADWLGKATPRLPAGTALPAGADPATLCIVETAIDFRPGGLPIYWAACREHGAGVGAPARGHTLAGLVSLIGRLHRVLRYQCFASLDDAQAHAETLATDPRWAAFVGAYESWVSSSATSLLRPAPLPSRRALFT